MDTNKSEIIKDLSESLFYFASTIAILVETYRRKKI